MQRKPSPKTYPGDPLNQDSETPAPDSPENHQAEIPPVDQPVDPQLEKDLAEFSSEPLVLEHPESIAYTFCEIARVQDAFTGPDQNPKSVFSQADLQMAITRATINLQAVFPELSSIEGGIRELDNLVDLFFASRPEQTFKPDSQHRIRVAANKIKSLINTLAQDMALIIAVQMISMGMTDKNPQFELVKYILCEHSKPKKT